MIVAEATEDDDATIIGIIDKANLWVPEKVSMICSGWCDAMGDILGRPYKR